MIQSNLRYTTIVDALHVAATRYRPVILYGLGSHTNGHSRLVPPILEEQRSNSKPQPDTEAKLGSKTFVERFLVIPGCVRESRSTQRRELGKDGQICHVFRN